MNTSQGNRNSFSFTVNIDRDGEETITTITSSTSPDTIEIVGVVDVGDRDLALEAVVTLEEIILSRTEPDDQSNHSG